MRTTDQTTTIQTPYAAIRLAEQLGMSVEKLTQEALELGLRDIDWNISEGCGVFATGTLTDGFDITRGMDNLSVDRFRQMLDSDTPPQEALRQAAFQRYLRRLEKKQEDKVVKLRCKPTLVS